MFVNSGKRVIDSDFDRDNVSDRRVSFNNSV